MQKEKRWWKKFSAYQIVAFVLTILFVIGIIVTISVVVSLKDKIDDTKKKNENLEQTTENQHLEKLNFWQELYQKEIIDFKI